MQQRPFMTRSSNRWASGTRLAVYIVCGGGARQNVVAVAVAVPAFARYAEKTVPRAMVLPLNAPPLTAAVRVQRLLKATRTTAKYENTSFGICDAHGQKRALCSTALLYPDNLEPIKDKKS